MNSVVHFEVPADDLERAQKFYLDVFGWPMTMDMGDTKLIATTEVGENGMPKNPGAINGDLFKRDGELKNPVLMIDVPNIDEHLKKISEAGGKVIVEKTEVENMGWCAYFKDTEGNVMGIWENIVNA